MSVLAVENLAGNTNKQETFAGLNVRWTCKSRGKTLTQSRHSTEHCIDVAFLVPQKEPRSTQLRERLSIDKIIDRVNCFEVDVDKAFGFCECEVRREVELVDPRFGSNA